MSMDAERIPGGYILLSRRLLESDLMDKPPLWSKLWIWMLLKANRKDGYRGLKIGQFFTTIEEMREAGAHMVGYRKMKPTTKEIRRFLDFLRCPHERDNRGTMAGTAKGTHGMLVTISKYRKYQDVKSYEGHNEGHNGARTNGTTGAQYKQEVLQEGTKKDTFAFSDETADAQMLIPGSGRRGGKAKRKAPGYPESFESFWELYPTRNGKKAGKKQAHDAWVKAIKDGQTAEALQFALQAQVDADHFRGKDGASYPPDCVRWLKNRRWEDELAGTSRLSPEEQAQVDALVATVIANHEVAARELQGGRA